METRILRVARGLGVGGMSPEKWEVPDPDPALQLAADQLRNTDVPVAFPTETVYGLGADATRSTAVKGIYKAKGRPSDNPLIVHFSDMAMLRRTLCPEHVAVENHKSNGSNGQDAQASEDPVPAIYRPLIARFWPGPLTILLPIPELSAIAPEVSAGLPTFGARMPASALARSLIHLAGIPLAAPSANASTRPSPTTAQHVAEDLEGRIALILDGGPCSVGVESTVVDGLSHPPVVLRPGGVSLEQLRTCQGWEGVQKAYKDDLEVGKSAPRAPGMKYKHYSPKARVILFETSASPVDLDEAILLATVGSASEQKHQHQQNGLAFRSKTVGLVRTATWPVPASFQSSSSHSTKKNGDHNGILLNETTAGDQLKVVEGELQFPDGNGEGHIRALDIHLGSESQEIAQLLFAALRELDRRGAEVILIEGVADADDIAAAVMNRLRKAASEIRS
jgi:L-threonylcarbamoyladenylate synthase